jgi:hypothetical protein
MGFVLREMELVHAGPVKPFQDAVLARMGLAHDADTAHSVREPVGLRWPVVDGIPFLRAGRRELAEAALGHLDAGEGEAALALLLADQDDWWRGPQAEAAACDGWCASARSSACARRCGCWPGGRCRLFRASLDGPDLPRRLALARRTGTRRARLRAGLRHRPPPARAGAARGGGDGGRRGLRQALGGAALGGARRRG